MSRPKGPHGGGDGTVRPRDGGSSGRPEEGAGEGGDGSSGPRHRASGAPVHNIAGAQDAIAESAALGRPGSGAGRERAPGGTEPHVPGPAGRITLRPVNSRHNLNSIGKNSPAKKDNTVVMPGTDTAADIHTIETGGATWNPHTQRYELPNGRVYGVESSGTVFPVSGPGFANLSRAEYQALKHYIRADGDIAQANRAMERDPSISESDKQAALEIFRQHRKYQGE